MLVLIASVMEQEYKHRNRQQVKQMDTDRKSHQE